MRPEIPDDWPVASDEHEFDSTDTHVYPPKFVHPLNARYVFGFWIATLLNGAGRSLVPSFT